MKHTVCVAAGLLLFFCSIAQGSEQARAVCCKQLGGEYRAQSPGFGGDKRCFNLGRALPDAFFRCVADRSGGSEQPSKRKQ